MMTEKDELRMIEKNLIGIEGQLVLQLGFFCLCVVD